MSDYRAIVTEYLKIDDSFLSTHQSTIDKRLDAAYDQVSKQSTTGTLQDTLNAINQCIHLASSIVLLGAGEHLRSAVSFVQETVSETDPTTVLTIAMLYYLLQRERRRDPDDKTHIKMLNEIHERFDNVNWMIGAEAQRRLNIQPLPKETSV